MLIPRSLPILFAKTALISATTLRSFGPYRPDGSQQGFVPAARLVGNSNDWTDFNIRTKKAALNAGFPESLAGQLPAAMGEFYSNVLDHSRSSESGYVVFSTSPGTFEFVVADRGVGVLESLRTSPAFANLSDEGEALDLALSEGVSRFYHEAGHGYGFRPLLVGLANISRHLRFRSGDYSHNITRENNGSIHQQTVQIYRLKGFLCSALCKL
ncbi:MULTISPECIES: hypothetical protein [unclassified Sinorhizobium]|uniref:hypothetical protein n=1 Tax=unclassified Sinorhizobium TaxID=2613772 RepID=UPI0035255011